MLNIHCPSLSPFLFFTVTRPLETDFFLSPTFRSCKNQIYNFRRNNTVHLPAKISSALKAVGLWERILNLCNLRLIQCITESYFDVFIFFVKVVNRFGGFAFSK